MKYSEKNTFFLIHFVLTSFSQLVHRVMIARNDACANSATIIPVQSPCITCTIETRDDIVEFS